MIALAAVLGLLVAIGLTLLRLFAGPTLYDRALAANAVLIKAALVCAALAVAAGEADWIDAAIALVLANLTATAAALKFFRYRSFQAPMAQLSASPRKEAS